MIEYKESLQFQKDFKKLKKKFKSLPQDFQLAKKAAIELYHLKQIDNKSVFEISGFNGAEPVYKLKKFACKSLKGKGSRSGIRIIYAYNKDNMQVFFIEIYYKGDQENETKSRISAYLKTNK